MLCYTHLYSYRYYQIDLSLSGNCVQASSYFVFVTALPKLGQMQDKQSKVVFLYQLKQKTGLEKRMCGQIPAVLFLAC